MSNPLFSLPGFSAELVCIDVLHSMDLGTTQDAIGHLFFDLVVGWVWTQPVFFFLYVCLRLCVCVCSSELRVHEFVFCLPCRSRILLRAVEERPGLLSCGTVSNLTTGRSTRNPGCKKLTWEMIRVDQKPPKLRAKGAETCHLVPCCYELATSTSSSGQLTASLSVD